MEYDPRLRNGRFPTWGTFPGTTQVLLYSRVLISVPFNLIQGRSMMGRYRALAGTMEGARKPNWLFASFRYLQEDESKGRYRNMPGIYVPRRFSFQQRMHCRWQQCSMRSLRESCLQIILRIGYPLCPAISQLLG